LKSGTTNGVYHALTVEALAKTVIVRIRLTEDGSNFQLTKIAIFFTITFLPD